MKNRVILFAAAALMATACQAELEPNTEFVAGSPNGTSFYASLEDYTPGTRSALQEDGSILWSPEDQINVFVKTGGKIHSGKFVSTNDQPASKTEFKGSLNATQLDPDVEFYAVYPYSEDQSFDGQYINVNLPAEQTAITGSVDEDLLMSAAVTKDNTLAFYNLFGGICFRVVHEGVKTVTFSGQTSEKLAGKADVRPYKDTSGKFQISYRIDSGQGIKTLTMTAPEGETLEKGRWYYLVSYPSELYHGYVMSFYDQEGELVFQRQSDKHVSIKRSTWGILDEESWQQPGQIPDNEIWYTTTDEKLLFPRFSYVTEYVILSNSYDNGMGRMVLDRPVKELEEGAFAFKETLSSITLPPSLETMGRIMFYQCSNLTTVSSMGSIREIPEEAFFACSNLADVSFPETLQSIGQSAFMSSGLRNIVLPDGLKTIADAAFFNCGNLQSVHIPSSVESIGNSAFYACGELSSVTGMEGVRSIGYRAFQWCAFDTIPYMAALESIGWEAFRECSNLSGDIVLGDNLRRLENNAFVNCPGITSFTFRSKVPPVGELGMFDGSFSVDKKCPIYIPAESVEAYCTAEHWEHYRGRMHVEGSTEPLYRTSTDYSRDGEVVLLQKATKGKGIILGLIGDGFIDTDMETGGRMESAARHEMERLFQSEPFASLRDRFTVYAVKAVSANDVYECSDSDHRFFTDYGQGNFDFDWNTANQYLNRIPNPDSRTIYGAVFCNSKRIVIHSSMADIHGKLCMIFSPTEITHELGGHMIGKLGDEYSGEGSYVLQDALDTDHQQGFYLNVDWRNTPQTVSWSHFLSDPLYSGEGLGLYEGGLADYAKGVYHPSEGSIMNASPSSESYDPDLYNPTYVSPLEQAFNAPSREAIYKWVMKLTEPEGWQYDFETFRDFDSPGRAQAAEVYSRSQGN